MGSKANPGPYDCYDKAEQDEPMFVLLARDHIAPFLVTLWATIRLASGEAEVVCDEAAVCARDMVAWARAHGREPLVGSARDCADLLRELAAQLDPQEELN